MKDIKTKEHNRSPKLLNPVSKMPKELVRSALLKSKEKSHQAANLTDTGHSHATSTEYASEKLESAEMRTGGEVADAVTAGGRALARKSYEKIKERKAVQKAGGSTQTEAEHLRANMQEASYTTGAGCESRKMLGTAGETTTENAGILAEQMSGKVKIRMKPEQKSMPKASGKQTIKSPRFVKSTTASAGKKVIVQNALQKKQAAMAAKKFAIDSARNTQNAIRTTKNTAKTAGQGIRVLAQAVAATARSLWVALGAGGAALILVLIIMMGVIGGAAFLGGSQSAEPVSQEVQAYAPTIQRYASQYGIPEYVQVIQAIMMQESGGRGTDPMQSSECPYNTRYGNSPNAITDPDYSIQVGIQYYADCLREAQCTSPYDMDRLKLSLQGYNYGNGYITWAVRNHGGYSAENALQFSQEQAASHGWARYGDPEYVPHVLRYYSGGNLFAGLFGNDQIVTIAKAQLGNEGGQKFWSWYGFDGRVEWCACFVSWCADQSGLIESGAVPKFALCSDGVSWFQSQNRWQGNTYTPTPGTIIFFDWGGDGNSDHVGIVEKCENGIVYTIEGNSGDRCKQNSYPVGYASILGYGILGM
ncbi:MAG: CHAP domain-containing protein [Lachnospiraceae bacterium]|nr:CHAP domain-containing protein [Lachnospiraceae bacterium]